MSESQHAVDWSVMHERMARVETESRHAAEALIDLKRQISDLDRKLDHVGQDVANAKTALRVGAVLWGFLLAAGGFIAGVWQKLTGVG